MYNLRVLTKAVERTVLKTQKAQERAEQYNFFSESFTDQTECVHFPGFESQQKKR